MLRLQVKLLTHWKGVPTAAADALASCRAIGARIRQPPLRHGACTRESMARARFFTLPGGIWAAVGLSFSFSGPAAEAAIRATTAMLPLIGGKFCGVATSCGGIV